MERAVGALFTLMAVGGVGAMWKVDKLLAADRDLKPVQQATLSRAIGQFSTLKFEVFTSRGDREAHALALKIVDAVKAGSGAMPHFDDQMLSLPPGVVLILDDKDADLHHNFVDTVGRPLMAARIAVMGDRAVDLSEHTVRIVVGAKP